MSADAGTKMDPAIKEAWLKELRSGRRKQGKTYLHTASAKEFCCLGVLCEIAVEQGITTATPSDPSRVNTAVTYDGHETDLPVSVRAWAKLPSKEFEYPQGEGDDDLYGGLFTDSKSDAEGVLMTLNDTYGWTFPEIADWIEENL